MNINRKRASDGMLATANAYNYLQHATADHRHQSVGFILNVKALYALAAQNTLLRPIVDIGKCPSAIQDYDAE